MTNRQPVVASTAASTSWPSLGVLFEGASTPMPGSAFKATDPREEAYAQAVPTGLRQFTPEDVSGLEEEHPLRRVTTNSPVVAIDAGVVNLGYTGDGVVGAVRAAAVIHHPGGRVELRTCHPGIFYLGGPGRLEKFHEMGAALGRDDFYVKVVDGAATEEKVRMGANDHRLLDRVRNFVERLVQKAIVEEFENAIVVFDGALTLRTYDTPGAFLRRLHETCQERGSSLIAVAKKTGLTVRGTDIRLLLDREGGLPARRKLTQALRSDPGRRDEDRTLGDLFVVRFGAGTETYRVDVAPAEGLMATEALDEFASACLYRHGYPEPLVQAHAFSYMAPPIVAELQKHAVVQYQLDVKPEPNLGPVFAPFGGRFK